MFFLTLHIVLFAISFILIFTWIVIKICNIYMVKKLNYNEKYKELENKILENKISSKLNIIGIIILIIFCGYFVLMFPIAIMYWLLFIFTLGGAMFVDAGGDSTFYLDVQNTYFSYVSYYKYILIVINIIIYVYSIRSIYNNILIHKALKNVKHENVVKNEKI